MNVVDSSAWLEYFRNGSNASFFAEVILNPRTLLIPSIVLFEVHKRLLALGDLLLAEEALTLMQGRVIDLNATLAVKAAKLSYELNLALADGIIYATSRESNATLWTQDRHFKNLPGVQWRLKND